MREMKDWRAEMAESMLREEVEVYSEKYDVHGVVRDYGMVTKL